MKLLTPLLLAACLALTGAAQAQTITLAPVVNPLDPALTRLEQDPSGKFEIRALSMGDAKALLTSTEGPAWQVLQVQAGACADPLAKEKDARKNCRYLKAECKKAGVFARQHAKHAACSALYTQTTVLLTNDAPPGKRVMAAPAAPKVSKPVRKPARKAKPVSAVRKPAASSC
jgi:hypothetical protein